MAKRPQSGLDFSSSAEERRASRSWKLLGMFLCLILPHGPAAAQVKEVRRVLIIYELGLSSPGVDLVDQGIRAALNDSPYQIELYREYLETTLFPDPLMQEEIRQWYIKKYSHRNLDLIIVGGPSSLQFLDTAHDRYFKGVPVVFCGTSEYQADYPRLDSDFTGVWETFEPTKTLDEALLLKPDTKHVLVISGTTAFDRHLEEMAKQDFVGYASKLEVTYLSDLAMPQILEKVRHLPDHTIVFIPDYSQDAAGRKFVGSVQASPMIVHAANAPVFSFADVDLGHGELGGFVSSFEKEGQIVGDLAIKILGGAKPKDLPITKGVNLYAFDLRALKRWGLGQDRLPPESIVLNREPTLWERGRKYFLAFIGIILVEGCLILGLFWQRTQRKKTEEELQKSEEKFSKAFQESPLAVTISRMSDSRYVEINEAFEELTGWHRSEVVGQTVLDIDLWADQDQRLAFRQELQAEGSVHGAEISYRRRNGQIRVALLSGELIEVHGVACALIVSTDITERKEAEEVLSSVSQRLIDAQEKERTRIARELHDDITQRLSILAMQLSNLQDLIPGSEVRAKGQFEQALQETTELADDVQALSHRLHSSKLEYLGLAVAAESFCKEFSARQNTEVEYHSADVPKHLSPEISLCLFRVLQESLQNAAKYSGVRHFTVNLEATPSEVRLSVHDSGVGFDPKLTPKQHGLGLISMTERLKSVDGQLLITSNTGEGTTILARVPFVKVRVTASAQD